MGVISHFKVIEGAKNYKTKEISGSGFGGMIFKELLIDILEYSVCKKMVRFENHL